MKEFELKLLKYGNILKNVISSELYEYKENLENGNHVLIKLEYDIQSNIENHNKKLKRCIDCSKQGVEVIVNIADLISWYVPSGVVRFITPSYQEVYLAHDLEELFLVDYTCSPEKIIMFKPLSYGSDEYHFRCIWDSECARTYHICEFAEYIQRNNFTLLNKEEFYQKFEL